MNFYDSNSGLLQNMYEKCDWECVSYQTFYQPNYGNILHLLLLVRIKDHIKLMIVGNNFEKTFLFLMFWKEFKRRQNSRNKMKLALLWDHIGLMIVRLKQFWKKAICSWCLDENFRGDRIPKKEFVLLCRSWIGESVLLINQQCSRVPIPLLSPFPDLIM